VRPEGPKPPIDAAAAGRPAGAAAAAGPLHRDAVRRAWAWLVALALAAAAVAALQTGPGRGVLDAVGARGQADGFTEVALVRDPVVRDGQVTFAFSVHDAEGRPVRYRWTLATTGGTGAAGGVVPLRAGERRTIAVRAAVRCAAGERRMFVGARVEPKPGVSAGAFVPCPGGAP
jgi:hypothetical protein